MVVLVGLDDEHRLVVLNRLSVFNEDLDNRTGCIRLNLVHEFHRLDDAERIAHIHVLPYLHKRICVW